MEHTTYSPELLRFQRKFDRFFCVCVLLLVTLATLTKEPLVPLVYDTPTEPQTPAPTSDTSTV